MKAVPLLLVALIVPLGGCLEVQQHPPWANGEYNGKRDELPQQALYGNDRLAWNAMLANRNHLQNEYGRMDQPDRQ
jgi:hypothetical protein